MNLAKDWNGEDLHGVWDATLKIDGVRAINNGDGIVSRAGKPLFGNIQKLSHLITDAEIYCGSFKDTVSIVRSYDKQVRPEHIFSLQPLDKRLFLGTVTDPTAKQIKAAMKAVTDAGHEGMVLRQGTTWLKVKPVHTYDVKVIGWYAGKGKHEGKIGGFITDKGRVGTGLTDKMRATNPKGWMGETIEVACMGLTDKGMFRQPRYIRHRFDK